MRPSGFEVVTIFCLVGSIGAWITPQSPAFGNPPHAPIPGLSYIDTIGALTRMPDGHLMDWWSDGEKGSQRFMARFSQDDGQTWSAPRHLFDFPKDEGHYGTGYINLIDRDGSVHLFALHYIGTGPGGFHDWDNAKSFVYHVKSSDNGVTWSRPKHCDFGYLYTGAVNSALQLRDGRLVVPVSYYSKRKTGKFVSIMSISDDGGETWRRGKGGCAIDNGGHLLEGGANEPVCVELQDGRLWMLIRTQDGYQHESFSKDRGETWSEPIPSRFVSSNAPGFFLRLRDGRLVFAWNNCMSPYQEGNILTSYDRQVLTAAISDDEGKTWQGYREIARVTGAHQQVTYPFLTETRGTSFFCTFNGRTVRVGLDWLKETQFSDSFQNGLQNWMTLGCHGADIIDHPDRATSKVLRIHKPKAEIPAAASLNFPFGVRGHMRLRILLKPDSRWPNRQHFYVCLTDFFSMPRLPPVVKGNPAGGWGLFPEGGRFKLRITPDGEIGIAVRPGLFQDEFRTTQAALTPGKWHTLELKWDCNAGKCLLMLDGEAVANLPQLSRAVGLCYLRFWMSAVALEPEGVLIESVDVHVER